MGIEIPEDQGIRGAIIEKETEIWRVLRRARIYWGDVDIDKVNVQVFQMGNNAKMLHLIIPREKVIRLQGAKRDTMVHQESQAPTPPPGG